MQPAAAQPLPQAGGGATNNLLHANAAARPPAPPLPPPPRMKPPPPPPPTVYQMSEEDQRTVVIKGMLTSLELERDWLTAVFSSFGEIIVMDIKHTPASSPSTPAEVSIQYADLKVAKYVAKCYKGESLTGIPIDVSFRNEPVGAGAGVVTNVSNTMAPRVAATTEESAAASLEKTVVMKGTNNDSGLSLSFLFFILFFKKYWGICLYWRGHCWRMVELFANLQTLRHPLKSSSRVYTRVVSYSY